MTTKNVLDVNKVLDVKSLLEQTVSSTVMLPPLSSKSGLFHLSMKPLKLKSMSPRVPDNFLVKHGYEDAKTKRISFTPSIDSALMAMSSNLKDKVLYVYAAPNNTPFVEPSVSQVPDSGITKERWVLEPVQVYLIGKIKVSDATDETFTYKYGNNTAELYAWNWKKC